MEGSRTPGAQALADWDGRAVPPGAEREGTSFHSILFPGPPPDPPAGPALAPDAARDLNLDQVVATITAGREALGLRSIFFQPLRDEDAIAWRHEVMRDLEIPATMDRIGAFLGAMRVVRETLARADTLHTQRQKDRVFVDAVTLYVAAIAQFARDLATLPLRARGLSAFAGYVASYDASSAVAELRTGSDTLKAELAAIRYCVAIRGSGVTVRNCAEEADYSAAVAGTFERFRQDAVKDYRAGFHETLTMNHVEAQILEMVAKLNPDVFGFLERFAAGHREFMDPVINRFFREIHFYILYLEYISPLRAAGLVFCYPEVSARDKRVSARETFDLALAAKLVPQAVPVVSNDFDLAGGERIFVVSGPNQGGKTTFVRIFGQLHHLASLGCPVPGRAARLFLCDRLDTHFEREETVVSLRGKLQDDLIRIHDILERLTPDSIVLMNEIFSSTTLDDAVLLATKVMRRIIATDCLAVCVTFMEELAALDPKVVSMVSTVVPEDPARRTLKIVRRPADGKSYAISIAEKYHLTQAWLTRRLAP